MHKKTDEHSFIGEICIIALCKQQICQICIRQRIDRTDLSDFLLSSRLYCRFWNRTKSAIFMGRGLTFALPPVGNCTQPRRIVLFGYSILVLDISVNTFFCLCPFVVYSYIIRTSYIIHILVLIVT